MVKASAICMWTQDTAFPKINSASLTLLQLHTKPCAPASSFKHPGLFCGNTSISVVCNSLHFTSDSGNFIFLKLWWAFIYDKSISKLLNFHRPLHCKSTQSVCQVHLEQYPKVCRVMSISPTRAWIIQHSPSQQMSHFSLANV